MPCRECANGGSAPEASDVRACEIAEVASPTPRKSVISAVVKLRREQISMAPLCSGDREQRQLPTMEIGLRQSEVNGNPARGGVEKVAAVGAEDGRSCLINARRLGFCADQSGTDRRSQGSAPAKPLRSVPDSSPGASARSPRGARRLSSDLPIWR